MDRVQGLVAGAVGTGADAVGADDRTDHADGPDQEREDHALMAEAGVAQDHGGDDRHLVALEDVGGHTGTVAHVVAHVVGDGGRVARVVLGNVGLDLAHQVGADIGRLGVDAAADPHEQCQQRAAEAEAEQNFIGLFAEDDEDRRAAEQAEAVGEHAGDGPGAVAKLQGIAVAGPRRGGDAEISPHRQVHSHKPDQPGENGPQEESRRSTDLDSAAGLGSEVEDRGDQEDQGQEGRGLPHQVGPRSLAHGIGHVTHPLGALVGPQHLADQHVRHTPARKRRSQGSRSNRSARAGRTGSRGRTARGPTRRRAPRQQGRPQVPGSPASPAALTARRAPPERPTQSPHRIRLANVA